MHAEKQTKIPDLTVHNNKIKIPKVTLQHLQNVTGFAKTGLVGTNYTMSRYRSYSSIGT